jgi:hypothetical protein
MNSLATTCGRASEFCFATPPNVQHRGAVAPEPTGSPYASTLKMKASTRRGILANSVRAWSRQVGAGLARGKLVVVAGGSTS